MAIHVPPSTVFSPTVLRHYSKEDILGGTIVLLKSWLSPLKHLDHNIALYADLPSMRASENPVATIPEDILVTSARPDIVLVGVDEVTLTELTIPHKSMESLHNARDRKSHQTWTLSHSCTYLICFISINLPLHVYIYIFCYF